MINKKIIQLVFLILVSTSMLMSQDNKIQFNITPDSLLYTPHSSIPYSYIKDYDGNLLDNTYRIFNFNIANYSGSDLIIYGSAIYLGKYKKIYGKQPIFPAIDELSLDELVRKIPESCIVVENERGEMKYLSDKSPYQKVEQSYTDLSYRYPERWSQIDRKISDTQNLFKIQILENQLRINTEDQIARLHYLFKPDSVFDDGSYIVPRIIDISNMKPMVITSNWISLTPSNDIDTLNVDDYLKIISRNKWSSFESPKSGLGIDLFHQLDNTLVLNQKSINSSNLDYENKEYYDEEFNEGTQKIYTVWKAPLKDNNLIYCFMTFSDTIPEKVFVNKIIFPLDSNKFSKIYSEDLLPYFLSKNDKYTDIVHKLKYVDYTSLIDIPNNLIFILIVPKSHFRRFITRIYINYDTETLQKIEISRK